MTGIGRLWRTTRYLKGEQILGRVWHAVRRPATDLRAAPPLRGELGRWVTPARREQSLYGATRFRFLEEEHDLAQCGWDDPAIARLWRYNLHYFDDLNAAGASSRHADHAALIDRWITENAPAVGTAWEPYPTSLRISNWIKWFLTGAQPEERWLRSLAVQTRWLTKRIEWHLLGNHLFANAKALVLAGLFFEGREGDAWLRQGRRILARELPEQVLGDGGHFERSTMYHALALEDVLDLLNAVHARAMPESEAWSVEPLLRERAARMLWWLRCMVHQDEDIGFFNDAAFGIAPRPSELEAYAERLGISAPMPPVEGVTHLAESGYVRVARGNVLALLDLAPVGPDYLLGHAHADTLSFELSLAGRRLVVNGGTSRYGSDAERQRERGTAWHSTVEVAGTNSSEVWSGFRVGRRARVIDARVGGWTIEGAHDGYRHLRGAPVHARRWSFDDRALTVDDFVRPNFHEAIARFHLAPGLRLLGGDYAASFVVVDEHQLECARIDVAAGDAEASKSEFAPRFGVRLPIQSLVVALRDGHARVRWYWKDAAHPVSH